jgi:hypothetical protein
MPAGARFTTTSYLDGPLDERYPYGVVALRVVTGDAEDPIARRNLSVAARLVEQGRLLAVIGTVAYRPGEQAGAAEAFRAAVGEVPTWLAAMIELDTGPEPIGGDRSAELGELHLRLAALLGNDARRVIAASSMAGFARVWPDRPAGLTTVLVAYGSPPPRSPDLLAWQYTNGFVAVDGLPSASDPFGRCPHVVAPQLTAAELAARLGTLAPIAADPLEDVVAMYGSRAAFEAMLDRKLGIDPGNADGTGRASVNGLLAFWLTRMMITLRHGTKNRAFQAPPELVDGVGLQGADPQAIGAAVAAALAPLQADVERLQKTIDAALGTVRR